VGSGQHYQHLYNSGGNSQKFIPVLLKDSDKAFIPVLQQGASYFVVDTESGYQRLYNRILGKPQAEKPPLGQRKPLPKKEVKTDIGAFISSPIDIDVWNAAKLRATAFAKIPNEPPVLGIAFLNRRPAEEIFKGWQERYGRSDEGEELRVSIIEGPVPNVALLITIRHGGIPKPAIPPEPARADFILIPLLATDSE
jgi:hypothetical protein